MKLFGTDGVRGEAGVKLNAFCALKLGIAAGIYYREHSKTNRILVGKDTRRSGYMLENALVSGLTAVGYEVIQIGPIPATAKFRMRRERTISFLFIWQCREIMARK